MKGTDSIDEPDDSEFWEDVKESPNRKKDLECIDIPLKDRKKACLLDHRRRSDSIEKEDAYSTLDRTLSDRKNAFFNEAERCERLQEEFSIVAAEDIDECLEERKRAFFYDLECRNTKSSHSSTSDEINTPLEERRDAFFSDAERCDSLRRNSSLMDNIDTPLIERKAAFFNEAKQNEIVNKDDTITDDIDRAEISYRRRSFLVKDLESSGPKSPTDAGQRVRHKVRRINSDAQLSEVLQRRRILSQTDDEDSDDDINNNNNTSTKNMNTSTEIVNEFSKLMHDIEDEYGWKV